MLCVVLFTAFALGSGEDSTASVSSGSGETQAAETEATAETLTAHVGDTLTTADLKLHMFPVRNTKVTTNLPLRKMETKLLN